MASQNKVIATNREVFLLETTVAPLLILPLFPLTDFSLFASALSNCEQSRTKSLYKYYYYVSPFVHTYIQIEPNSLKIYYIG